MNLSLFSLLVATSLFVTLLAAPVTQSPAQCGQTPIEPFQPRIIGGQPARPYSWPWQAALCQRTSSGNCWLFCGGSLVADQWVLTAAHCVNYLSSLSNYNGYSIKLGVYNYTKMEEGEITANISSIYVNPLYGYVPYAWDVALIKLTEPVTFTDHIQPVCVPSNDSVIEAGNSVFVTGWGATQEGGWLSDDLMQVEVPIVSEKLCDKAYDGEIHNDTMFCAGVGGRDSCQGDSGGPVVHETNGKWFEYGIVSWGRGCAREGYPDLTEEVCRGAFETS